MSKYVLLHTYIHSFGEMFVRHSIVLSKYTSTYVYYKPEFVSKN